MCLLAHVTNVDGQRVEQMLKAHCVQTAEYSAKCLENIGFYHTAYLTGVLHDMGKANMLFQDYLEKSFRGDKVSKGSVIHTFTAVIYLLEKYHSNTKSRISILTSEIIGYAVGAHHGLFDCVDLCGNNGFRHRLDIDRSEIAYEEACQNFFAEVISEQEIEVLFHKAEQEIQTFYDNIQSLNKKKEECYFHIGLLTRLLTSAVIYGDRRDTREFMGQKKNPTEVAPDWKKQLTFLEEKLQKFDSSSKMNQIRTEISNQCFQAAEKKTGIYRLSVPTGGGKTLSALRFALAHAANCGKKKIIFIIPLLSVLDQNAKIIREYISDDKFVLEHHSNVLHEHTGEDLDSYEVLAENWESPVIISTLVQFLNMLFAKPTSAIGRMHALCNSIIVIDEVQSLPKRTLEMFSMAMNFLSQFCNTTILLSSATQPCFENLTYAMQYCEPADLVHLNENQLQVFKRSEIVNCITSKGMSFDECAEFCRERMEECCSLLVICNTKSEARNLFQKMQSIAQDNQWKIYHLSTSMCQQHRMDVLKTIEKQLKILQAKGGESECSQKIICISTQLVEAGIDFSFESVVRVIAGMDNLAQAAGRCNRSNEYGRICKVYLIRLQDENLGMLQEIYKAQISTMMVLEKYESCIENLLLKDEAIRQFYHFYFEEIQTYRKYPIEDNKWYLVNLLANQNSSEKKKTSQQFIFRQPFKTVAEKFQVYDNDTIDILVPYEDGTKLIQDLKRLEAEGGFFNISHMTELLQKAKHFTVSIFENQKKQLLEVGMLDPLFEERILVLNEKAYHEDYGIGDITEPEVASFIF